MSVCDTAAGVAIRLRSSATGRLGTHPALRYRESVLGSERPDLARRNRSARRMDYLHVSLPAGRVLEYRRECERLLGSRGDRGEGVVGVGQAGVLFVPDYGERYGGMTATSWGGRLTVC